LAAVSISSPMFHSGTGLEATAAGSTAVALGALGASEAPSSGALVDPDPDPADDSSSAVPALAGTGIADGGEVVHTGVEGLESGRTGLHKNPDFLRLALDPAPPPPTFSVFSAKARAEGSALEENIAAPLAAAAPSTQQMVADVWGGGLEDAPEPRSEAPPGPASRLEAYPSWGRALSLHPAIPLSSKRSAAATTEATRGEIFSIANPLLRGGRTDSPAPSNTLLR